jgi:murein DD-endopeptidase MepM/ murein hydrolase activator NlpD
MDMSRFFKSLRNKSKELLPLSVYVAVVLLVFALFIPVLNREIKERLSTNNADALNTVHEPASNNTEQPNNPGTVITMPNNAGQKSNITGQQSNAAEQQSNAKVATGTENNQAENMATEETSSSLENKPSGKVATLKNVHIEEIIWPLQGEVVRAEGLSFSQTFSDYRYHNGIDIAAERGTEAVLVLAGQVSKITTTQGEGTSVTVDHGQGWVSVYAHLAETALKEGESYQAGAIVGTVNQPGLNEVAEGPHLHYSLFKDEQCINPLDYLKEEKV